MKKNFKTIKVDINEEITSVVDRLIESKEKNIVLAVPKGANIFQNIINIKLLRREADNLNKDIALVTHDPIGQKMADQAGILTLADIEESVYESEYGAPKAEEDAEEYERASKKVFDIRGFLRSSDESDKKRQAAGQADVDEEYHFKPTEAADKGRTAKKKEEEFFKKQKAKENILHKLWTAKKSVGPEKIKDHNKKFSYLKAFIVIFGIASIVAALFVFSFVFQKAEIVIETKKIDVMSAQAVKADILASDIVLSEYKIPARMIRAEKTLSKEFDATGSSSTSENAKGKIKVYKAFSSSPQTMVATTRFLSKEGKLFRLVKTTIIPGAQVSGGKLTPSYISVDVAADQAGPDYNIGPTTFSIPGFLGTPKHAGFYGESNSYMAGGASVGQYKIATKEDIDKADTILKNEIASFLNNELDLQVKYLSGKFELLDGAKNVVIISSAQLQAIGDKFRLEYKGNASAIVFNRDDLLELLSRDIFAKSKGESNLIKEGIKVIYEGILANVEKGQISFIVKYDGKAQKPLEKDLLADKIAGASAEKLNEILNEEPIEGATVTFRPFWLRSVPSDKSKINIFIK